MAPFVLKDVYADLAIVVYVRVEQLCFELQYWRLIGVIVIKINL